MLRCYVDRQVGNKVRALALCLAVGYNRSNRFLNRTAAAPKAAIFASLGCFTYRLGGSRLICGSNTIQRGIFGLGRLRPGLAFPPFPGLLALLFHSRELFLALLVCFVRPGHRDLLLPLPPGHLSPGA